MTEHKTATSNEEGAIEETFRKQRGDLFDQRFDLARNKDLAGLAEHIDRDHPNADFNQSMYDHLAAIGRGEVTIPPARISIKFDLFDKIYKFIKIAVNE